MQPLETPPVELACEGFVLALHEVFGHYITNKEFLAVDLPSPSMWHPRYDIRVIGCRENLMQFAREVRGRLLSIWQFTQRKVGVIAIGMIDATRWSSTSGRHRALE